MTHIMLYGATGYTGRLIAEHAQSLGLPLILAGRSHDKTASLAAELGIAQHRSFVLGNTSHSAAEEATASILRSSGVSVLINAAGPFSHTAAQLVAACIRAPAHYLDISAELSSYESVLARDNDARAAGVMLLPGCGGSVAMLGCLVAQVVRGVASVTQVDVALRVAGRMSRGSIKSALTGSMVGAGALQQVDGVLVSWRGSGHGDEDVNKCANFDFGDGGGLVSCSPATLPDLLTIPRSMAVRNIRTFVYMATPGGLSDHSKRSPDGPTVEERTESSYHAAATVFGANGSINRAVLHTVNGYTFTAMAAVEAARRVLNGTAKNGFQTPVTLFGAEFVQTIAGSNVIIEK